MTAVDQPTTQVVPARPYPARYQPKGSFIYKLITTTDHKLIGMMSVSYTHLTLPTKRIV